MRKPDKTGQKGMAWKVEAKSPSWAANIAVWLINLPDYHPMLQWFTLITNHLRPIPNLDQPYKFSSDCTHEFVVAAYDPETYLFEDIDPDKWWTYKITTPLEVEHQFVNLTDAKAIKLTNLLLEDVLSGFIQPSADERSSWVSRIHHFQKFIND